MKSLFTDISVATHIWTLTSVLRFPTRQLINVVSFTIRPPDYAKEQDIIKAQLIFYQAKASFKPTIKNLRVLSPVS